MDSVEYRLYREVLAVLGAIESNVLEVKNEEALREIAIYRREINRRIDKMNL